MNILSAPQLPAAGISLICKRLSEDLVFLVEG